MAKTSGISIPVIFRTMSSSSSGIEVVKVLHQDAVNTISIKAVISVILTTIVLILTKSHKKLSCVLALGSADVLCTTKSAEQ